MTMTLSKAVSLMAYICLLAGVFANAGNFTFTNSSTSLPVITMSVSDLRGGKPCPSNRTCFTTVTKADVKSGIEDFVTLGDWYDISIGVTYRSDSVVGTSPFVQYCADADDPNRAATPNCAIDMFTTAVMYATFIDAEEEEELRIQKRNTMNPLRKERRSWFDRQLTSSPNLAVVCDMCHYGSTGESLNPSVDWDNAWNDLGDTLGWIFELGVYYVFQVGIKVHNCNKAALMAQLFCYIQPYNVEGNLYEAYQTCV
ncbi:hypothetical protein V1506DRAFT_168616 [Lipomyces tetrasporus]